MARIKISKAARQKYWLLRHIHSSSRFDRSPASLLMAVLFFMSRAGLITLTETTNPKRSAVLRTLRGFGLIKVSGVPGAGDPAILYKKKRLAPQRVMRWVLTDLPIPDRGKTQIVAVACVFQDLWSKIKFLVIVAHLPAHLYDVRQMRAWIASVKQTGVKIREFRKKHPGIQAMVVCDWNVDMRNPKNRARIKRLLAVEGMESAWAQNLGPLPDGGTHHRRIIDDTQTDIDVYDIVLIIPGETPGVAKMLRDSSDHDPYEEVLILGSRA